MLKNTGIISGVICAVALPLSANADGPGWTGLRDVIEVVNVSNGGINVRLSPELHNCVPQAGYGPSYAYIVPDHPGLNLFQSNLLAAMMAGKKVSLYLQDDNCKVSEMRINK